MHDIHAYPLSKTERTIGARENGVIGMQPIIVYCYKLAVQPLHAQCEIMSMSGVWLNTCLKKYA